MDSKHRVTIPARWRRADCGEFFLVPGHEKNHLLGYPSAEFEKVSRLVEVNESIPARERQMFIRHFYSRAQLCPIDKQGRILLTDDLQKLADIESEIFLVGAFNRFEIWNPTNWLKASEDDQRVFSRVATMIGL